jgi:hypothetical protein
VLSESAATLVLDHKARVVYATDKLATMLGYPVASLLKMELGALLPQPTCQLYKPWLSPVRSGTSHAAGAHMYKMCYHAIAVLSCAVCFCFCFLNHRVYTV